MNTTKTEYSFSPLCARTLLLLVFLVLATLPVNAYSFKADGFNYTITSDSTVTLERSDQGYSDAQGDLIIPESVSNNGHKYYVTEIGIFAFYCSGITSLELPKTVQNIQTFAFRGCHNLTSLTISNCSYIQSEAFGFCKGLKSVTIGAGVKRIYSSAFSSCSELTDVIVEKGDKPLDIDGDAFSNCHLKNLYLDRNLNDLFGFKILTPYFSVDSVFFGDNITKLPHYLFYNCTSLTNIDIPNNIKEIGRSSFWGCTNLKEIDLGNGVEKIDDYAFWGCTLLESIDFGNKVTDIGSHAFYSCKSLKDLDLPKSLKSICSSAFSNCSGISQLSIPNSVTSIYAYAFQGCIGLKKVIIEDGSTHLEMDAFGDRDIFGGCPVQEVYMGRNITGPDNDFFATYKDSPFSNMKTIKKFTIGNKVTTIPWNFFSGCDGIRTLIFPNVYNIGFSACGGCPRLKAIVLGNGLSYISDYGFHSCDLDAVYTMKTTPPQLYHLVFSPCNETATLYVPIGSKQAYQSADGWKDFKNIVEIDNFDEVIANLEDMYGYVPCDANGDREVSIADVNTVIDAILDGNQDINYDMNEDFEVNIADINAIINMILSN